MEQDNSNRINQLEDFIERQHYHQLQSDIRIHNQREEIKRLEAELARVSHESHLDKKWRYESEAWNDKNAACWKIRQLESQNTLLQSRMRAAKRYLDNGVAYETLRKWER